MIWILLFKLIFSGGSHTTFFLTPSLKKNVKTYVVDKERQKDIFSIMKVSKKKQKVFAKTRKGYKKQSQELNLDRKTTREQYLDFIEEYLEVRKEIQDYSIDSEMAMKKITTEAEWANIMNALLESNTKNKARKKLEKESRKLFGKLVKACEENIADAANREKVLKSVQDYRDEVDAFIPILAELGYRDLENIRNFRATKADYEEVTQKITQQRQKIMNLFLDTRFEILELTTEEEWNKIIKAFNQLVKKDQTS